MGRRLEKVKASQIYILDDSFVSCNQPALRAFCFRH